jgi:predicted transcriptional regulator
MISTIIFGTFPLRFAGFPVSGWIVYRAAMRESLQFSEGITSPLQTCSCASYPHGSSLLGSPQIWNFDIWYHFDTVSIMAMTLRLTEEEKATLERLAQQLGVSKQKALIEAMNQMETKAKRKRDLAFAREFVMTHDKELMERLADA